MEVIVVDDHSSDDTALIVARLAGTASRWPIRLFSNPGVGKAAALNHAYSQARGHIYVLLGGDDLVIPHVLAARTAPLLAPEPRVVTCRYQTISSDKELDGHILPRGIQSDHIAGGASSFNGAFADLYFPIPENLPNEDTWLRAVVLRDAVPVERIEQIGLLYRLHAGNTMGQDRPFKQASQALRERHQAYEIAALTGKQNSMGLRRLDALCRAERMRTAGRWYAIPFIPYLSRGDIVTNLVNSREWIYLIKSRAIRLKGRLKKRRQQK